MIRIDNRDPQEIEAIIRWCQNDDFWFANILSAEKLRKHYDALTAKMNRDIKGGKKCLNADISFSKSLLTTEALLGCGCEDCMATLERM